MALIYLVLILILLCFIILLIYNKKDKLIKRIIKSFLLSLYIVLILFLITLAFVNNVIFLLLLFACFAVSYMYNKEDETTKRLFKSSIHSLCVGIITFLVAIEFLNNRYDIQDLYPNIPIFEILDFLGYASIYVVPILYIIVVLIYNKKIIPQNKKPPNS